MLNIALLGACPVQLSEFCAALDQEALALGHRIMLVTAGNVAGLPAGLPGCELVLLAGLEAPFSAPFKAAPDLGANDHAIRTALAQAGVSYRVLYGTASERLALALQAVESLLPAAGRPRQATGPGSLKKQPWVWMCEKCSDPQCEHRLLTDLLARRDSKASLPGQQSPLLNR